MKRILTLIVSLLVIHGCSTDFDITAPYKEIMVVDGLLNALDPVQSIRVGKAFLGEGDANIMAQQKDSINYGDVLDVYLDRIKNGSVLSTSTLVRNDLYDKDTGVFYSPYHVLYTTNDPILQDGSEYKIRVINRETGVTATSQTKIVKNLSYSPPLPPDPVDLVHPFNAPVIITFSPGEHAVEFTLTMRLNYRDIDQNGNSTERYTDWTIPPKSEKPTEVIFTFKKVDLYSNWDHGIPVLPGITRRIDSLSSGKKPIEYIMVEGSEDLNTYMELQKPTTGIVQERPAFSTVQNGLGIFTSRIIRSDMRNPNQATSDTLETVFPGKNFDTH